MVDIPTEILGIWRSDEPPTVGPWHSRTFKFDGPGGVLARDANGRMTLRVTSLAEDWPKEPSQPQTVWGITTEGQEISLLDARLVSSRGAKPREDTWIADTAVIGGYAEDRNAVSFDRARVELRGLRAWLSSWYSNPGGYPWPSPRPVFAGIKRWPRPGTRHRPHTRSPDPRRWAARAGRREVATYARNLRRDRLLATRTRQSISVSIDGCEIHLNAWTKENAGPSWRTDSAAADFVFSEPISLSEFEERWLRPLEDLVAFGTDSTCVVEQLKVRSGDLRDREIVRLQRVPTDAEPHEQLQPLPAAIAVPRGWKLLTEWYRVHKAIGAPGAWFFGYLNGRTQWLDNQVLNLLSFAEVYHRTFHDRPLFDDALNKRLMAEVLPALPDQARHAWKQRLRHATSMTQRDRMEDLLATACLVVPELEAHRDSVLGLIATRNKLTHGAKAEIDVEETILALDRLVIVFRACIGVELGLWTPTLRPAILWPMRYRIAVGLPVR